MTRKRERERERERGGAERAELPRARKEREIIGSCEYLIGDPSISISIPSFYDFYIFTPLPKKEKKKKKKKKKKKRAKKLSSEIRHKKIIIIIEEEE